MILVNIECVDCNSSGYVFEVNPNYGGTPFLEVLGIPVAKHYLQKLMSIENLKISKAMPRHGEALIFKGDGCFGAVMKLKIASPQIGIENENSDVNY